MTRWHRGTIRFDFVGYGDRTAGPTAGTNRLFWTWKSIGPGALDHHHLAAYSRSTASLVLAHPDLVQGALAEAPRNADR